MQTQMYSDVPVSLTMFFLKSLGLWMAGSSREEVQRKIALGYTVWTLLFSITLEIRDLYFTLGDYYTFLYVCCNVMSLFLILIKTSVLIIKRIKFINLIAYMHEHFWNAEYDRQEMGIMNDSRKICNYFITLVLLTGHCSIFSYLAVPIVANIGKNESERILPFNMWLDLPLSITPYYEIMFVIQALTLYHVSLCYFTFDNCLCILTINLSCQFRILQERLTKLSNPENCMTDKKRNIDLVRWVNESYVQLKSCIRHHQELIYYSDRLEDVFTLIAFGQVLIFSLLICLFGYQLTMPDSSFAKRCIFAFLLLGSASMLFMFTYSCHNLTEESDNVGLAAYSAPWTLMPITNAGKMIRNDLVMIALRSKRVCCLTANGFFPVTLETYTSVINTDPFDQLRNQMIEIFSTAVSYFTLLKQSSKNVLES